MSAFEMGDGLVVPSLPGEWNTYQLCPSVVSSPGQKDERHVEFIEILYAGKISADQAQRSYRSASLLG